MAERVIKELVEEKVKSMTKSNAIRVHEFRPADVVTAMSENQIPIMVYGVHTWLTVIEIAMAVAVFQGMAASRMVATDWTKAKVKYIRPKILSRADSWANMVALRVRGTGNPLIGGRREAHVVYRVGGNDLWANHMHSGSIGQFAVLGRPNSNKLTNLANDKAFQLSTEVGEKFMLIMGLRLEGMVGEVNIHPFLNEFDLIGAKITTNRLSLELKIPIRESITSKVDLAR